MKFYKNKYNTFIIAKGTMANWYVSLADKIGEWEVLQIPLTPSSLIYGIYPPIEITALEVLVSVGHLPKDL